MDALLFSSQASRQVALIAVVVDAKDSQAVEFSKRYEFIIFR